MNASGWGKAPARLAGTRRGEWRGMWLAVLVGLTLLPVAARGAWPAPARAAAKGGAAAQHARAAATLTFSGVVRDAQSNDAVGGAVILAPGVQATADGAGHYQITLPGAPRVQLQAAAQGYQWRPPLTLSMPDHSTIQGQITFDFSGSAGLQSAFRTPQGDSLSKFDQVVPATSKALAFAGSS